jgi:hypothetical protein
LERRGLYEILIESSSLLSKTLSRYSRVLRGTRLTNQDGSLMMRLPS